MSKKLKISLLLISTFIVFCFGVKFYLDKTYLNQFEREDIVGEDRYKTMVKISEEMWDKSKEAVLVSSSSMLDAISASPFAYKNNIPTFYIENDNLNSTIKGELERLGVEKVYLIGGESSISSSVSSTLDKINIKVQRIEGETGLETTLLLAKKVIEGTNTNKIAVVNRDNGIADGISFLTIAQKNNIPIILIRNGEEDSVINFVKENNIEEVYILGSEQQIPKFLESEVKKTTRFNGKDRYETNKKIIKEFYNISELKHVYITKSGINTSSDFLNSLSIAPIATRKNAPIILSKDTMDKELLTFLENNNVKTISEIGFKYERPKLINKTNIRYVSNIVIIGLCIFGLRRII